MGGARGEAQKGALREDANRFSADEIARDLATIHTTGRPKTLLERVQSARDAFRNDIGLQFRQYWLDSLAALESAEKAINKGKLLMANMSATLRARLAKNAPHVAAFAIGERRPGGHFFGGMVRWNPEKGITEWVPGSKPLTQVLAPIFDRKLEQQWAMWMIVKRAERPAGEGREHNVPPELIEKYRDLDKQYLLPDGTNLFEQVRDDWRKYNSALLDYGVATGIINPETRPFWEGDDYVPFYRALNDDGGSRYGIGGGGGIANKKSPIHKLTGSDEKIGDLSCRPFMPRSTPGRGMRRRGRQRYQSGFAGR